MSGIWGTLLSAFVASATSIAVLLLKERYFFSQQETKRDQISQDRVREAYFGPLSDAATKLLWRFSEMFLLSRSHFLLLHTQPKDYNDYKRKSTIYRLAVVLAWVRALERELTNLRHFDPLAKSTLRSAISAFQSALADGGDVEVRRLESLCNLWSLPIPEDESRKRQLAASLEVEFYAVAGEAGRNSREILSAETAVKERICRQIADQLCLGLKHQKLEEPIIVETTVRALSSMAFRESWVYRDWQDAIADSLLVKATGNADRHFDVRTYADFCEILDAEPKREWFKALISIFENLDLTQTSSYDVRKTQLEAIGAAVSEIVLVLKRMPNGERFISNEAHQTATKLAERLKV
jgi:hypothetical protein